MESSTLTGIAGLRLGAASAVAPSLVGTGARVVADQVAPASSRFAAPRPQPFAAGACYGVSDMWRDDLQPRDPNSMIIQDFDKFTTRQGPPICSPPA